jgi:hypothetical protein
MRITNWFRVILDRKTHDAKFRLYNGTGQEINLQIQAELDKATKQINDLLNRIDLLKEINATQDNIIQTQLTDIRKASENAEQILVQEETIAVLEEAILDKDNQIEALQTKAALATQKLRTIEQSYEQQLKDQLDATLADSIPKNSKCALVRVEITFDQYDDGGIHIHSERVATVINPRQQKNEIATRLRNLLDYLKRK